MLFAQRTWHSCPGEDSCTLMHHLSSMQSGPIDFVIAQAKTVLPLNDEVFAIVDWKRTDIAMEYSVGIMSPSK
jgi:hypothetical protein